MLTQRQQILYKYQVSLYRPTPPTFSGEDAMRDTSYIPTLAYSDVPCFFNSAAEVAVPSDQGLQSEANMFTYYIFSFDAAQEIDNTWVMQFTTPNHPNTGDWFFVTDVPKTTASSGQRTVNRNQVFAKRGDKPNGVA